MKRYRQPDPRVLSVRFVTPGFTMLEVIVVIAILALLAALLLPAIHYSRESSRRTTCGARLRQVGVAVLSHEEVHRRYPQGMGELSWHYELFPFVEQSMLYVEIKPHVADRMRLEQLLDNVRLPIFVCPSDTLGGGGWGSLNFVKNNGSTFGYLERNDGFFGPHTVSSGDVVDGLSQTVFASEAIFLWSERRDRRGRWKTPIPYPDEDELDLFSDLCATMPTGALGLASGPEHHLMSSNFYEHIMTPNQPSCLNYNMDNFHSTFAASSDHAGGVNVLLADGAVKFIGNSVARKIWRAVGTKNGREPMALP